MQTDSLILVLKMVPVLDNSICSVPYLLLQRLLFQKAFNSQQLVHVTVINLFQLHHLRDFSNETEQHSYSQDEQLCWTQLLALFSKY